MKKCFGIISWFPDKDPERSQRLKRLDKTFKHLTNLFGKDIEFLIIAQNWKDYQVPDFIEHTVIHKFDKLGILGARKMLREKFLELDYDYLIMCDDDIVLKPLIENAPKKYFKELDKHPEGFSFLSYGWSLTFCAVSKWIYSREEMVDIDPEKNEGYEDTTFPNLLHYKYPDHEFKTNYLFKFLQNTPEFRKDHKSTWMVEDIRYAELKYKSDCYIEQFKKGNFNIALLKPEIEAEFYKARHYNPEKPADGKKDYYLYF